MKWGMMGLGLIPLHLLWRCYDAPSSECGCSPHVSDSTSQPNAVHHQTDNATLHGTVTHGWYCTVDQNRQPLICPVSIIRSDVAWHTDSSRGIHIECRWGLLWIRSNLFSSTKRSCWGVRCVPNILPTNWDPLTCVIWLTYWTIGPCCLETDATSDIRLSLARAHCRHSMLSMLVSNVARSVLFSLKWVRQKAWSRWELLFTAQDTTVSSTHVQQTILVRCLPSMITSHDVASKLNIFFRSWRDDEVTWHKKT